MKEHPETDPRIALAASVKAVNDTLNREGLFPSALVFGKFPRAHSISEVPQQRTTLAERVTVASLARKEMRKLMSEVRVNRALKHKNPSGVDQVCQPGDKALFWRENIVNNRFGE